MNDASLIDTQYNTLCSTKQAKETPHRKQVDYSPSAIAKVSELPGFELSVLQVRGNHWAVKKFSGQEGKSQDYNCGYKFKFHYRHFHTLEELAAFLIKIAVRHDLFVIRGRLKPNLTPSWWHRRLLLNQPGENATIDNLPLHWFVFDFDGPIVPPELGRGDMVRECGLFLRDHALPEPFRGVRGIASATASTGLKGPDIARLRLWFLTVQAIETGKALVWVDSLPEELCLDPGIMRAERPIYTGRPIFVDGEVDPVPGIGRVVLLDGHKDRVDLDLSHVVPRRKGKPISTIEVCKVCKGEIPEWMLPLAEAHAGWGIGNEPEVTDAGWRIIDKAREALRGVGRGHRHDTLNEQAFIMYLAGVRNFHILEEFAKDVLLRAGRTMDRSDGKYNDDMILDKINEAFKDGARRA